MVREMSKYIIGIIVAIFVIIISIPIWESSFSSQDIALINEYKDMSFQVDYEDPDLKVINNKDNEFINSSSMMIKNTNNYKKVGTLYFVLSSSTFDYNYINIMFDDQIYKVSELDNYTINDDTYFKIKDISFSSYEEKEYNYKMWIDESISKIDENDTLTIDFKVK